MRLLSVTALILLSALGCSSDDSAGPSAMGGAGAGTAGMAAGGSAGAAGAGVAGSNSGNSGASTGGSGGAGTGGALGGGGTAGGGAGGSAGSSSANPFTGTAQIMVLGSSNELITCWRAFLWKKLQDANQKDFDLVGDVTDGPDCGVAGYDKDLRATSGTIVTNLTSEQFAGWFTAHPADAMLVHFGGADLLQNLPIPGIIAGYDRMLAESRKVKPTVRILMGQHTPQNSDSCDDCLNTVPALNAEITKWATANTQPTSPVLVVDLFTGIDPATDTSDGIHLNEAGSAKVAERFYAKLSPFFAK